MFKGAIEKLTNLQTKLQSKMESMKDMKKDESAEYGRMILVPLMAVVSLAVALILVSGIIPDAINGTTISTTAWSSGAQSMWESIPTFALLAVLLIFIGIAVGVIKFLGD